jgi:hypothetical protein
MRLKFRRLAGYFQALGCGAVWMLAFGCARVPQVEPFEPVRAVRQEPEQGGGPLLQGFDVQWDRRPHRVRALAFRVASADGHPDDRPQAVYSDVRGGTWASGERGVDFPTWSLRWGELTAGHTAYWPGTLEMDVRGSVRGALDARATDRMVVRSIVPCRGEDALATILTGFGLRSHPSHPHGFTPRAVAVELREPRCVDGAVEWDVEVEFSGGSVPDRTQRLWDYGGLVRVDYAVVVVEGGSVERVEVETLAAGRQASARGRGGTQVPVRWSPDSNTEHWTYGLSGFSFLFTSQGPLSGRYLRSLSVGLDGTREPGSQEEDFVGMVRLRMANTGPVARPGRLRARAAYSFIASEHPMPVVFRSGSSDVSP